jgi:hypothetical protein
MRLFFLIAFLIASSSAFAPVAINHRSNSALAGQGSKTSTVVKAAEKVVPPGKKATTKAPASPPKKQVAPPSKTSPMKGVPASKTTPRPKAVFGIL